MAGKKFDITKFAATLPEAVPESGTREQIEYIDEAKLSGDGENFYSMEGIEALAQNIELVGLQQPLRVRPDPDDEGGYIVVSGHRRLTAIRTICKVDEPERWRTVPCIVERGELSPAMRELRLIYANSDTRRMSNADLGAQAERVEKLLYQLQEEGVEFPGRMRDHVAEVCQISKSKLARLKVIREGLSKSEQIAKAWEKGELPEAAALEIARMDDETQYRLLDWVIDHCRTWSINNVREFSTCWTCCKHKCPDTGGFCPNAARMYADRYRYGEWRCAGCCRECLNRDTCSTACRFVVAERPPKEPEPAVPRNPAADDPRLKNMTPKFCERVKALREATGLTRREFAESIGEYPGTYSAWENNSLAGAGSLPKLALTLGTTMDYLCGLTDEPAPKPPTLFSVDLCSPVWQPLDAEHWPTEGALVVLSYETGLGGSSYLVARCAGGADDEYPFISTDAGTTVDDIVECRCDRWMPLSECRRGEEGT
jgi:ParB family chromosome partitioning protein